MSASWRLAWTLMHRSTSTASPCPPIGRDLTSTPMSMVGCASYAWAEAAAMALRNDSSFTYWARTRRWGESAGIGAPSGAGCELIAPTLVGWDQKLALAWGSGGAKATALEVIACWHYLKSAPRRFPLEQVLNEDVIQIVVLAFVAGFVLIRLYTTLGR